MPFDEIRIEVSGDNRGVIIAGDNNTVNQIKTPFRLARLPPRRILPEDTGPAALLSAHYELAPFVDSPERAALSGWLEDKHQLGALLVSAPGGYGKTRLGIEVCRRAAAAGWHVLLAGNSLDLSMFEDGQAPERSQQPTRGTLVFLDYADRWPQDDTEDLIRELARHTTPVRLLLAARSETFWPLIAHPLRSVGFRVERMSVSCLTSDQPDRVRELYVGARRMFAQVLGVALEMAVPDFVGKARERSVLEIHTRALLDALREAESAEPVPARAAWAELSRELIERELNHWGRMAQSASVPVRSPLESIFRCTVLSTLMRGLSFAEARRLLSSLAFDGPDQLIADHARLYPSPKPDVVLWPLLPDRIGEDLIASAFTSAPESDRLPGWGGPACDQMVTDLLAHRVEYTLDDGTNIRFAYTQLRSALVVLAEAGQRWPHVRQVLADGFRRSPQLAVIAGGRVLAGVAEGLSFEALRSVCKEVIGLTANGGTNLDLQEGLIRVLERLHGDPSFDALPVAERIRLCDSLGLVLTGAGRKSQAVHYHEQAVDLVFAHQLKIEGGKAIVVPGADMSQVGATLAHFANALSARGDSGESLLITGVSITVFQQWLAAGGDEHDTGYLAALAAHATALADNGYLEESLELHEQLLSFMGGPVDVLTDQQKADATVVMNNLGLRLFEAGKGAGV